LLSPNKQNQDKTLSLHPYRKSLGFGLGFLPEINEGVIELDFPSE